MATQPESNMSPSFQIPLLCIFLSVLCSIPIFWAEKDCRHYSSSYQMLIGRGGLGRISKPQIIIQNQPLYSYNVNVNKQTQDS